MLKHFALRVATLAETDRSWLLSNLSVTERQRLEPLITEAMSLGLHKDPSVLAALTLPDTRVHRSEASQSSGPSDLSLTQLAPFWRSILQTGQAATASGDENTFEQLLTGKTGPSAMRQCIQAYVARTEDGFHV